ncbi:N-acetyltransferase [Nocardia panacis]|uniref:Lysine N-acyltransferase MbtK n=1 Tax=Nocardia panacis TaxID=2340916 RepID=A0A3A4K2F0_9NOCA|nr:GNAT family N-acetyltransferase [Nocardia panacis]RJO72044.1 N-acetyltransferase [Nocardia panacis]
MSETATPYVLARELIDAPAAIRRGPAPTSPRFDAPFTLRAADPEGADPDLLAEWMRRPHLLQTWEQAWTAERRRLDWRAQLAGTYSRPYILVLDFAAVGQPELGRRDIAYVELYRPGKDEVGRLYAADPYDMGFHIATADPALLGRGLVSGWIGQLATAVFAAEPECRRIICDPDHRNAPMRRALAKNGYRELGLFDVRPDRRIALCELNRA